MKTFLDTLKEAAIQRMFADKKTSIDASIESISQSWTPLKVLEVLEIASEEFENGNDNILMAVGYTDVPYDAMLNIIRFEIRLAMRKAWNNHLQNSVKETY